MAYTIINPQLGFSRIGSVDTVQACAFGTIVQAVDPTYGAGEFIYLKGVASTIAGSWVTYNHEDGTTALLAPNAIGPVAVATAATDSTTEYGWYQITGLASAYAADVADSGKVYIDTAAGRADDAVVVGDRITNAKWASVESTSTNLALARLSRPFVTDQKDAT